MESEGWKEEVPGSGALIDMRLWLTHAPWRLSAAWAALAGALASGTLGWHAYDWIRLLLLAFLVDSAWGELWRVATERRRPASEGEHPGATRLTLPYLRPAAPLGRLMGRSEGDWALVDAWRSGLPGLGVALLIAVVVGREALLATGLALILCLIGWATSRLRGQANAWVVSLLIIGLPWMLGHWAYAPMTVISGAAAVAFVVWQRAALGIALDEAHAWRWLALAQGGVIFLLALAGRPLGVAALAAVILPPWWARIRTDADIRGMAFLRRAQMWWWLALLISGWVLGGKAG